MILLTPLCGKCLKRSLNIFSMCHVPVTDEIHSIADLVTNCVAYQ